MCGSCQTSKGWYDSRQRHVRDLGCAGYRIVLELQSRRGDCRRCGRVKLERLDFLADNSRYTERFGTEVGARCWRASVRDLGRELALDWHTVKTLEKQYMRASWRRRASLRRW